jgi:hypothetical protein
MKQGILVTKHVCLVKVAVLAGFFIAALFPVHNDRISAADSTPSPAVSKWLDVGKPVKAFRSVYVDVDASRHALNPSIVLSDAGPTLGWIELTVHGISQIFFGHWDRSAWIRDGGSHNLDATQRAFDLSMSSNGRIPYLAWIELNAKHIPQLHVKHLEGRQWTLDGGSLNLDPMQGAANPALSATGPVPYLAWTEPNARRVFQLYVKQLSEDGWQMDGDGSLNISPMRDAIEPAIVFGRSGPYVVWAELSDRNVYRVYVKRWIDSSWQLLDRSLNLNLESHALSPSIAFLGETPYVAWIELNPNGVFQLQVKRWENGSWTSDGKTLNNDPARHALSPALVRAGSILYLAWTEYDAKGVSRIHVKHRGGEGWVSDDPSFNSATPAASSAPALAASESAVYVSWKEVYPNGLAQIVVKRLQAP